MSRDYRKLRAFALADELVLQIYRMTKTFPREEMFGLTSQMRKAAVSIPANIAEGAGRRTLRDYLNFLGIAMGSLAELSYYIELYCKLGYLREQDRAQLLAKYEETSRTLQGLIQALNQRL